MTTTSAETTLTDRQLEDPNLFPLVLKEGQRQVAKWGVQTRSGFEWVTYLTEEVGELAEAVSEHRYRGGSWRDVQTEAIQVATLALKIAEMYSHLDVDKKGPPESPRSTYTTCTCRPVRYWEGPARRRRHRVSYPRRHRDQDRRPVGQRRSKWT